MSDDNELSIIAREKALLEIKILDLIIEVRRLSGERKRMNKQISLLALKSFNDEKTKEYQERFIDSERQGLFRQKVKTIKRLKKENDNKK